MLQSNNKLVSSIANRCRYQSFSNMSKNIIFLENKFKFTKQLENGLDYVVTHVKRCIRKLRYDQEDVIAGTICSELILVCRGPTARFFRVGRLFGTDFPIIGQCNTKIGKSVTSNFGNIYRRDR